MVDQKLDIRKLLPNYWFMILWKDDLQKETFSISDLGVSSRVFSHWKKMNLIPFLKESRNVKLNIVEYFWIRIIHDLRGMGFSIESIEKLKGKLFVPATDEDLTFTKNGVLLPEALAFVKSKEYNEDGIIELIQVHWTEDRGKMVAAMESNVPLFNFIVISTLTSGANLSFVINDQGDFEIYQPSDGNFVEGINQHYDLIIEQFDYAPVLVISLRKYLYDLLSDPTAQDKIEALSVLKPVELEVLSALRQGNVSELKILFDNKSSSKDLVFTYKGVASNEELNRISAMFYGKKHVKLEMKSNDGKTVLYEYQVRKRHKD
jgi:hypothetical protein